MTSRRMFVMGPGLTAAMSRSAVGANDKIRMGVLGFGARGSYMGPVFANNNPDCQVVAVADVYKPNRDRALTAFQNPKPIAPVGTAGVPQAPTPQSGVPDTYVDYRRVLERKDVDAVLIAAPDHWHAQMLIEACQAGKDAYCEKPLSNSIEAAAKARDFVVNSKQVVQIGLQQRSWDHFQMCCKWVQEGRFGTIYHAALHWQGHYSRPAEQPTDPPADLDWELFQGPAPRKPYSPSRQRSWRGYYDYGGGIITDQGVHIGDLVHWYMVDNRPLSVNASAQWVRVTPPNPEQPPDTFAITWQYGKFVMSYANTFMTRQEYNADHGVFFYGTTGALHVNRTSYEARPLPAGGRGQPAPALEPVLKSFAYVGGPSDLAHVRNFLDCVRSRQKTLTDVETGFTSTLPLLLGVLAVRYNKMYAWDGKTAVACS
jgi:predicted dehydrogenase